MKKETNKVTVWYSVGVFCAFALLSAITFAFFSPAVQTNAANTLTTKATANIKDVMAVAAPDASKYAFGTITPTELGTPDKRTADVTVTTNHSGGYKLFIANNTSETRMVATGNDTYIEQCASGVTLDSMGVNKWGYSKDGTNFYPITPTDTEIYNNTPLSSTSAVTHSVTIGLKVGNTLKSGTYSNVIKFTAVGQ